MSNLAIFLGIYIKEHKSHIGNIELCNINFIHGTAEYNNSIYDIWHSQEMNKLRGQFINKDLNEICKKCLNAC